MLDDLRFVQGAVARKDFVPVLTHFRVAGGRILGYNGTIALSSPIALDLACNPHASDFVKAIQTCPGTIQLHIASNGKLAVKSEGFSAFIDCSKDEFPDIVPVGQLIPLNGIMLLDAIKTLAPFVSEDASRVWSRGILFRGPSAFATNNIILLERWLGVNFPVEVCIRAEAVTELQRIDEEPIAIQLDNACMTFHFQGGRWLRTQLSTEPWPDISQILDQESSPVALPDGFFQALEDLRPFTDQLGRFHCTGDELRTHKEENVGASVQLAGAPMGGSFNVEQFLRLKKVVQKMDLTLYPGPCLFFGELIRGAIVGMVDA